MSVTYTNWTFKISNLISKKRGAMYFGAPLSWMRLHSPWPEAQCLPVLPAPGGSLSRPLVWRHDWLGTLLSRPSSGCLSALGSFPFSDQPGAPSELPSQI
ncbi:hypothetical protein XENOCAPTIV_029187 [Xenoophorus captivus]|uniref:Uncharacterized protein n=1 Tax=Xenoophorus captivus TaxID=1517983 RepID=A0ABV0QVJ2_9TELE